jgi:large subunit ribosomal protein L6
MSRVGKNPVAVPSGVEVRVDGTAVTAKGKQGQRTITVTDDVLVSLEDNKLLVKPANNSKRARAMWGTTRSLLDGLVMGVDVGFSKALEINGVGYRAGVEGNILNLQLGFSHEIRYPIPDGVKIEADRTSITVSGADKQQVGQVSAEIRAYRPPEPYKGKGIRLRDEIVIRKEGKKK